MTSPERVHQVCLVVYQAIASVQQQQPELLNERYRSLSWQQSDSQNKFISRLSAILSGLFNEQAVVEEVQTRLRQLLSPEFFQTSAFLQLMSQISQIMGLPSALSEPQADEMVNQSAPVESGAEAIALLLLDIENFQPDVETEKFLEEACTYPLRVKIAFANWRSLGKKDVEFHNRHYDLMHVPGGKDMADGKMIAVGSAIHEHYPSAKEILVCSSDRVMTSLCTKLRQRGLVVYQVRQQNDGEVTVFNSHTQETRTRSSKPNIPSLEACIAKLKELIRSEQQQTEQIWVPLSKISQLFARECGFTISQAVALHCSGIRARDLFSAHPQDFAVHHLPDQEIYISLFQVPGVIAPSDAVKPDSEVPKVATAANSSQATEFKAALSINQVSDLETVLVAIVKELTANGSTGYVDVGLVGSQFYRCYQQPVTTVIKHLKANKTFPNFLASCKTLKVQQKNKVWQVTFL